MSWHTLLILGHIIGTVIGAGAVTFAGIFYWYKRPIDSVSELDAHFLAATYTALRIGMALLVLSGFGFFLEFRLTGKSFVLYSPQLLAKLTIVLVILINALLHHWRRLPFLLGSLISAVSWYAAVVLGIVRVHWPYWAFLAIYVAVILILYPIAQRLHKPYSKA